MCLVKHGVVNTGVSIVSQDSNKMLANGGRKSRNSSKWGDKIRQEVETNFWMPEKWMKVCRGGSWLQGLL